MSYVPQRNTLRQMLIHSEEFGCHNLNVFTFFGGCFDGTHFLLWALLRGDWKEDELAVIDCRQIIDVTFFTVRPVSDRY